MAPEYCPSNYAAVATGLSRASLSARSSSLAPNDEHQEGHARLAYRALPHTHRLAFSSLASRLVARIAFASGPAITNSARRLGSRRSIAQSLGDKAASQLAISEIHHLSLSKACSRAGSINASKGFQGRGIFIQECGKIRTRERSHD